MLEIGGILFPDLLEEKRQKILDDFADEEVKYLYENGAILYEEMRETIQALNKEYDLYS